MEKMLIFDEKDVRISLVDIEDATDSPNFRILIENNSSFDLDFKIESFIINGYAVECYMDADVRSHKKKFEYLYVEDADWACLLGLVGLKGIEDICSLGFSFKITFSGEDEEDDDEDYDGEDCEYYELECPTCGEIICFDDSLSTDEITCPACGEKITDIEICDGNCDACDDEECKSAE